MACCCAGTAKEISRPWRVYAAALRFPDRRATFGASGRLAGICMSWRATTIVRCSSEAPKPPRLGRLPVALGPLRFDNDHAIGAAAPVHRGAGCVLEDLDGRDIVRTDPRETAAGAGRDRNAVNDVERLVVQCEAGRTADLDCHAAVYRFPDANAGDAVSKDSLDGHSGRILDGLCGDHGGFLAGRLLGPRLRCWTRATVGAR